MYGGCIFAMYCRSSGPLCMSYSTVLKVIKIPTNILSNSADLLIIIGSMGALITSSSFFAQSTANW